MKKLIKSALALALVVAVIVVGTVPAFAAKGNGARDRDRLKDASCGTVCIYEGECPLGCDGVGLRDGSCGICLNDGVPKLDGSGGVKAKGYRNNVK